MDAKEGKPGDETLSAAFDRLKSDGAAWLAAEHELVRARAREALVRLGLAAFLAFAALLAVGAATLTLANMLVDLLTPALGAVLAGACVALGLFIAGALLLVWVRSLLSTRMVDGRMVRGARTIWSALNEPN